MTDINGIGVVPDTQTVDPPPPPPPPVAFSIKDQLPEILGILAGDQKAAKKHGMAALAESTVEMGRLEAQVKAMRDLTLSTKRLSQRIKNGMQDGQEQFLAAYNRQREKGDFLMRKLWERQNVSIELTKPLDAKQRRRAQAKIQGIQNTIGQFDQYCNDQLETTAKKFGNQLLADGAITQAQKVLSIGTDSKSVPSTPGPQLLSELSDQLDKDAARYERNRREAERALGAERQASQKQRKKIADAAAVLRSFTDPAVVTTARAKHEKMMRLTKDVEDTEAAFEKAAPKRSKKDVLDFDMPDSAAAVALIAVEDAKAALKAYGKFENPDTTMAKALETVAANLPSNSQDRVAFEGLAATIRLQALNRDYDRIKDKMNRGADDLKPGSFMETSLEVEAGLSYSPIPGVLKFEFTGIYGIKQKIERLRVKGDGKRSWKATFEHSEKLSVNTKVADLDPTDDNKALFKANVEAGLEFGVARTYDTFDELLAGESEKSMGLVFFASNTDVAKAKRAASSLTHERDKLVAIANQAAPDLAKTLQRAVGVPVTLKADIPKFMKGAVVTASTKAIGFGTNAATGFSSAQTVSSLGGINASFKHKRKEENLFLEVPYLDHIKEDQMMQTLHKMAHPKLFGFYNFTGDTMTKVVYGDDAVTKLNEMERTVSEALTTIEQSQDANQKADAARKLEVERERAWQNLDGLRHEYDQYIALSNAIENEKLSDSDANRQTRDYSLTKRGLSGQDRAGFVRAMSLQYAVAQSLYLSTFSESEVVPTINVQSMASLEADLTLPKLGLTRKQIQKEFGYKAKAEPAKINSTTITFGLTGGTKLGGSGLLDFADGADTISDGDSDGKKGLKRTALAGISINAEANFEEKWKPGDTVSEKKLSLEFAVGNAGGGILGGDVARAAMVAKLLDATDVFSKKGGKEMQGLTDDLVASLRALGPNLFAKGPIRFELVNPTKGIGGWYLKETHAYELAERKMGARFGVGGDIGLVVGFNTAKKTRRLVRTHRAVKTLSGIGETFRSNNSTGATTDESWQRFREETRLLDRLVAQLDAETSKGAAAKVGSEAPVDFAGQLVKLNAGKKFDKKRSVMKAGGSGDRANLATDVLDLLSNLNGGDDAEKQAVNEFAAAWKARSELKTKSKPKATAKALADATNKLGAAFDKAIAKKSAKEGRTFVDDFQKPTLFKSAEINQLIVDDLTKQFTKLRDQVKLSDPQSSVPSTLPGLEAELRKKYKKKPDAVTLRRLKAILAISHTASTVDDLTAYNDEADKEKALGYLSLQTNNLAGPSVENGDDSGDRKQLVYVNSLMDGELVKDGNKLKLRLVIKKDFIHAVDATMLSDAHKRAVEQLNDGAGGLVDAVFTPELVSIDEPADGGQDGVLKKWTTSMHNKSQEDEAFQKLADKKIPATLLTNRIDRRKRARRTYGKRNHGDILKAIAVVLQQQDIAKKRPGPSKPGNLAKQ